MSSLSNSSIRRGTTTFQNLPKSFDSPIHLNSHGTYPISTSHPPLFAYTWIFPPLSIRVEPSDFLRLWYNLLVFSRNWVSGLPNLITSTWVPVSTVLPLWQSFVPSEIRTLKTKWKTVTIALIHWYFLFILLSGDRVPVFLSHPPKSLSLHKCPPLRLQSTVVQVHLHLLLLYLHLSI